VVRRVKDARYPEVLFPVWRYHPFFTNSGLSTVEADLTHRRHAIIETVFADLIDGPLAHMPSGRFGANSTSALCAGIAHNLLHAAGTLAGTGTTLPEARHYDDESSPSQPGWPAADETGPTPTAPLALDFQRGFACSNT
jgi:hypothetical protein